jgi:hypothetical protein
MPVEEVRERMVRPWGLKQALRGQWPDYMLEKVQSVVEARLDGGLWFMRLGELFRNSPEDLADILREIVTLKEDAKLEIREKDRHLIYRKEEEKGEVNKKESDPKSENIDEKTT